MKKYEVIFECLKDLRAFAETQQMPSVLKALEQAEDSALEEMFGVHAQAGGDDYGAVMVELFPHFDKRAT